MHLVVDDGERVAEDGYEVTITALEMHKAFLLITIVWWMTVMGGGYASYLNTLLLNTLFTPRHRVTPFSSFPSLLFCARKVPLLSGEFNKSP